MIAGRYRLGERIGEGGMAAVYLANRADDGIEVAVKILRPEIAADPEVVRRFLQEARAASLIRHPKIVGILDFGFTGEGVAFLVMERLVGDDLADVLGRDGPFTWQRLAPLALDVCAALAAAHEAGIVHRDVKPENCFLLTGPDGQPLVKVLDFGIAKDVGGSLPDRPQTATGMLCGSPEYIAPEVIMGKVAEVGSDIYALGITIYELLTGSHPFVGAEFGEMLAAHVQRAPPTFASRGIEVPPGVEELVQRCLAKHPDERPPSMVAVAAAIKDTLRGNVVVALPKRRVRGLWILGVVLLLAVLAGLGALVFSWQSGWRGAETAGTASATGTTGVTETSGAAGSTAATESAGSASSTGSASGGATTGASTGDDDDIIAGPIEEVETRRGLSKRRAKRLIRRKIASRAKRCLRKHTSLVRGQRFAVDVVIDSEGMATATAKLLPQSPAASCIGGLFSRTQFPLSRAGGSFVYKFSL